MTTTTQRIAALIHRANVARWAAMNATDDVTQFLAARAWARVKEAACKP